MARVQQKPIDPAAAPGQATAVRGAKRQRFDVKKRLNVQVVKGAVHIKLTNPRSKFLEDADVAYLRQDLAKLINEISESSYKKSLVVIDMNSEKIEYVSSAVLEAFVDFYKGLRKQLQRQQSNAPVLIMHNVHPKIFEALKITGSDTLFNASAENKFPHVKWDKAV